MNKQNKLKTIIICLSIIALISIFFNIYLIITRTKPLEQDNNQITNNNENIIDDINADEKENNDTNIVEIGEKEEQEPKKEYIYKYIGGKEKEVVVEKEIKVEVPASPTDATVTYMDSSGNSKTIKLPSGTIIDFSSGEHGIYDSIPSSITLTDNQELDITDSSYNPSKVEVNYIFKGLSYSGNTMKCEYSLADNIVNVECKQIATPINKVDVQYIQLDYIESTGTQWINTGLTPIINRKIEIDCIMTHAGEEAPVLFGAVNSSTGRFDVFAYQNKAWYRTNNSGASSSLDYLAGQRVNIAMYTTGSVKHYFKDGIEYTQTETLNSGFGNIYIMRRGQAGDNFAYMKLFGFKVYDNDSLIMDLIPVERLSDGKIGMLDQKNGNFFVNGGSGEFSHPDINSKPVANIGKVIATGSYETGSNLTLTATANDGYKFVKWLDGNTNLTRTVVVGNNNTYTALFAENN